MTRPMLPPGGFTETLHFALFSFGNENDSVHYKK